MNTVDYRQYLRSPGWRCKRLEALKAHGRQCCKCGSKRMLRVHHKTYVNLGHEEMDDLEVMCEHCHRDHHDMRPLRPKKRKKKVKREQTKQMSHREWQARQQLARSNVKRHHEEDAFIPSNMK